jgi:3-deoxy-D-manno-octulosonic-acid transferase
MIFPKIAKKIFGIFDLCICSNVETKNYFEKLNLKKVYFKGNIKLINQIDASKITNLNHQTLLKRKFWFAASTHKEEDSFCLKTHIKLKKKFKNVLTIIAPRHINRSFEIRSLAENLKLKAQILNKGDTISENIELIIINYFGALQSYFKYAKSVFIGKSMIKKLVYNGGQNPIEAAMFNCKVYHGPYVYNFEEIYKILEINNISKKINNYRELSDHLLLDLEFSQKKIEQISNPLKNLGQKTLIDTMSLVDNFINNDAY